MTDYQRRVNRLLNEESYNETEPWSDQFLAKMDRLGLMLAPAPDGPDCVQAPGPASDDPDRWPTPSYIVDRKMREATALDTALEQHRRATEDILIVASFIGWHDGNCLMGGRTANEAFQAFARVVDLDPATLLGIARGWPVDKLGIARGWSDDKEKPS